MRTYKKLVRTYLQPFSGFYLFLEINDFSLKIKVEVNVEFELNQPLEVELFTTLNINNRIPERRLDS